MGLNKLFLVNVSPILFFSKFAFIIFYDLLTGGELSGFAVYSLLAGLTSSVFMFSSLRGRVYVLNYVDNLAHLNRYNAISLLANIIGFSFVLVAYRDYELFTLLAIISIVKAMDNIFEGNISFLQKKISRDLALRLINIKSSIVFLGYASYVFIGDLFVVLIFEALVGLLSCVYLFVSIFRLRGTERLEENVSGKTFFSELGNMFELSLCAGLNALINTIILIFLVNGGLNDEAEIIAMMFSVFSICARVLTINNIFFKDKIDAYKNKIIFFIRLKFGVLFVVLAGLFLLMKAEIDFDYLGTGLSLLYLIIFVLAVANLSNVFVRQHLLLLKKVRLLICIHFVEVALVLIALSFVDPSFGYVLLVYSILRFSRVVFMVESYAK